MALIHAGLYSEELMRDIAVSIILPLPSITNIEYGDTVTLLKKGEAYKTLWLLPPSTSDHTKYVRRSRIEAYARESRTAVVMMNLDNSYCCNIPYIGNYFDFYTEELPALLRSVLPLSDKREDNYIGGVSAGGFGAFMAAARKPEYYCAAFSISGGLDLKKISAYEQLHPWYDNTIHTIYGNDLNHYDPEIHDLYTMMGKLADKDNCPVFYACCGTEDKLYDAGYGVISHMKELGLPITYEEGQGNHDFDYYDPQLKKILTEWLPAITK